MIRFWNLAGVYEFDESLRLQREHRFSDGERDALLIAAQRGDTATMQQAVDGTGIAGGAPDSDQLCAILTQLRGRTDAQSAAQHKQLLYEANLRLTRQEISASATPDLLIMNTINCIEEIDKVVNTLTKRLREWYALYDPELEHQRKDHREFVEAILAQKARAAVTMGGTVPEADVAVMRTQAERIQSLNQQREALVAYLEAAMQQQAPNTTRVAGAMIGAKLLAMAGSLARLSRLPSSTVQLLGAETALFRHLRNPRARPPKHGIIFNHVLLQRASRQLHGKVARLLADKISIAAKVDHFKGQYVGDALAAEIERKIANEEEALRNEKRKRLAAGTAPAAGSIANAGAATAAAGTTTKPSSGGNI